MENYTKDELQAARRAITSLPQKCEKALDKLEPGKSRHTLTKNRIQALRVSSGLIAGFGGGVK